MVKKETTKIAYLDYMRIFALIAVIVIHVSAYKWYVTDVNGFQWQTFNAFNSISRWCVPLFVMISGAIFLERDVSLEKIYRKYIFRLLTAYIVWAIVYALFSTGSKLYKASLLVSGYYHMWYIPMMIGLYMCIPFIKAIVDKGYSRYFLGLAFVFSFFISQCFMLVQDFGTPGLNEIAVVVKKLYDNMHLHMILGYPAYFILGYYLNRIELTKKKRITIYIFGIVGAILTLLLDSFVAIKTQEPCSNYYDYITVNVLMESICMFVLLKNLKHDKLDKTPICKLSKYTFGAYLIHPIVIESMDRITGFNTTSINPVLSMIVITLITFVFSMIFSALINHVPKIGKYIS